MGDKTRDGMRASWAAKPDRVREELRELEPYLGVLTEYARDIVRRRIAGELPRQIAEEVRSGEQAVRGILKEGRRGMLKAHALVAAGQPMPKQARGWRNHRLAIVRNESAPVEYPTDVDRPRTRADCLDMPRPCPFVSCSHHLYLDVSEKTGSIKLNAPHLEVWEMPETCSLDVADKGGVTLEEVGAIMNLTRERIRQVEVKGLEKIKAHAGATGLSAPVERGVSPMAGLSEQ